MRTHENIKNISKNTGLKQYIIAQKCGYDPKSFSQIVNGRKPITENDIIKICKGLNVTPNDLITL